MRDPADRLRARITQDLRSALKARDAHSIAALRTLVAAIDNAGAVAQPAGGITEFGVRPDVPRKVLRPEELRAVVRRELEERLDAAGRYERLGLVADAERLRAEAAVIERYVDVDQPGESSND